MAFLLVKIKLMLALLSSPPHRASSLKSDARPACPLYALPQS